MTDQHEEEITFLDIAVFFAENWIVIFLLPAVVAVAAFFISAQIERNWSASTTIDLPSATGMAAASPLVMIISSISYSAERLTRDEGVEAEISRNSITISTTQTTREDAERAIDSAIAALAEVAAETIERHERSTDRMAGYLDRLEQAIAAEEATNLTAEALATAGMLRANLDQSEREIELARAWLDSISSTELRASPLGRGPLFFAAAALAIAGMLATLFAMARVWWINAKGSPEAREKINRILSAFWLPRV